MITALRSASTCLRLKLASIGSERVRAEPLVVAINNNDLLKQGMSPIGLW